MKVNISGCKFNLGIYNFNEFLFRIKKKKKRESLQKLLKKKPLV